MADQAIVRRSSNTVGWVVVAFCVLAAYAWPVYRFFAFESQAPEYQSFPFIIAAIAALAYFRFRDSAPRISPEPSELKKSNSVSGRVSRGLHHPIFYRGLGIFSSLVCMLGVLVGSPWIVMISLFWLAAAVLLAITKLEKVPGIWAVWVLLFLLLPLPLNLDSQLTTTLQLLSSWLSSQILEAIGVLHLLRGNTLQLSSKELFVDEACSGIVSLITIISAIAIYCVWLRRSLVHTLAMLTIGIAWTTLMNTMRIVSIAAALDWWGLDWSEGWQHTLLAIVLFIISLGVLKAIDYFLNEFFRPIDAGWRLEDKTDRTIGRRLMVFWDRWLANSESPDYAFDTGRSASSSRGSAFKSEKLKANNTIDTPRRKSLWMDKPIALLSWPVLGILLVAGIMQPFIVKKGLVAKLDEATLPTALALNEADNPAKSLDRLKLVNFESAEREAFNIFGQFSRIWTYQDDVGRSYILSFDFLFGPEWHELATCYRGSGWTISDYKVEPLSERAEDMAWPTNQMSLERTGGPSTGLVLFNGFDTQGEPVLRNVSLSRWDVLALVKQKLSEHPIGSYYQLQVLTTGEQIDPEARAIAADLLRTARVELAHRIAP